MCVNLSKVPPAVRESIIEWAGENDIEIETLNELLTDLGLEEHAEYVEVEVTVTALLKVRVTSEMAASDVLQNSTYEGLEFDLRVAPGHVEGVYEAETEDITSITVDGVAALND